jgi:hypothetical protein
MADRTNFCLLQVSINIFIFMGLSCRESLSTYICEYLDRWIKPYTLCHKSTCYGTDTIPGISDHDIVYTEFDPRPVKLQQKPRTIPLYNKANWYGMKIDL